MTYDELKSAVESFLNDGEDPRDLQRQFFNDNISMGTVDCKWTDDDVKEHLSEIISKGISFKSVQHHGGEGQGEDYYTIYEFSCEDQKCWVDFHGSYASYDGATYNECCFVKPQEVMVIRYVNE